MLYSCAHFSKINGPGLTIEDVCPKIRNEMRVELKKKFDVNNDKFMETYILYTSNNSMVYNVISETHQRYVKFNPIEQEIETIGKSGEKKIYKDLIFGRKNREYDKQLNGLLEDIKSFDNTKWMYFNLNDVIECIEKGRVIEDNLVLF
jgi:hypothetical protein